MYQKFEHIVKALAKSTEKSQLQVLKNTKRILRSGIQFCTCEVQQAFERMLSRAEVLAPPTDVTLKQS